MIPGGSLGAYRLGEVLGEGATGVVYRAVRERDGVEVALKVLRSELARDEVFARRFSREARAAHEIDHPNVVSVLDSGLEGGRHYLAMAYVDGPSLADRLREGPLPVPDVVRITAEVAAGLDALHRRGLVHRDIKPANVMLSEQGTAALMDFGLAKSRAYTVLTKPGEVVGTVDYLAPEVIAGEEARPAADIYALGCVAYACASGTPPFAGGSIFEVTARHLGEEPSDPFVGRPDGSAALSAALLAALAKEPGQRPPTARAYGLSLWRAYAGTPESDQE